MQEIMCCFCSFACKKKKKEKKVGGKGSFYFKEQAVFEEGLFFS